MKFYVTCSIGVQQNGNPIYSRWSILNDSRGHNKIFSYGYDATTTYNKHITYVFCGIIVTNPILFRTDKISRSGKKRIYGFNNAH